MEVIKEPKEMQARAKAYKRQGKIMGFVPTMGYFHEGHLSLIRRCRDDCDVAVVSIFVNPLQFGPTEDFQRYPRDLDRDLKLAHQIGVDIAFTPDLSDLYPPGFQTYVEVTELTKGLEGFHRPSHFKGVTTVVAKLFNIVLPDRAYFGEKDYQQLKVIEKMVSDLNFPVDIVPCPTIREPDGLAMSSRNVYLSSEERQAATVLNRAIKAAQNALDRGLRTVSEVKALMWQVLASEPRVRVQYVEVVDPETLNPVAQIEEKAIVLIAAFVGSARLIDEGFLSVKSES